MELQGRGKRLYEVCIVLAAGVAAYLAWHSGAIQRRQIFDLVIVALLAYYAVWIILSWLKILPVGPKIEIGKSPKR